MSAIRHAEARYRLHRAELPRDGDIILALWRQGLDHGGAPKRKLDWYYGADAPSRPIAYLLIDEQSGTPVGTATIGERRFSSGGRSVRAGLLVDFVLHAEHRTLFPALSLQRAIRESALKDCELVYGFPNAQSLAVVRRAGYREVGRMVRHVRVLRSARYLARVMPSPLATVLGGCADFIRQASAALNRLRFGDFRVSSLPGPDESISRLYDRLSVNSALLGERNANFLKWRFFLNPQPASGVLKLETGEGKLAAYAVFAEDADSFEVLDFLVDPAIASSFEALWCELILRAYRRGLASLVASFCGDPAIHAMLVRQGLLERSSRPVYAAIRPDLPEQNRPQSWYFTLADEDA